MDGAVIRHRPTQKQHGELRRPRGNFGVRIGNGDDRIEIDPLVVEILLPGGPAVFASDDVDAEFFNESATLVLPCFHDVLGVFGEPTEWNEEGLVVGKSDNR